MKNEFGSETNTREKETPMRIIDGHTFDETLLNPNKDESWILDIGCGRDFEFSKQMSQLGYKVIAVDPLPNITPPKLVFFENSALVSSWSNPGRNIKLYTFSDLDCSTTVKSNNDYMNIHSREELIVNTITIDQILTKYKIKMFDLVKMDCEGSEYSILMSLNFPNPISKMFSVEFHDFRGMNPFYPFNELYYRELVKKIGPMYRLDTDISPRPEYMKKHIECGHYDCLLTLRKDYKPEETTEGEILCSAH